MTPTRATRLTLRGLVVVVAIWSLILGATPVGAESARPGGTESIIDGMEPDVTGVHVEVLGGDSFVQVTAKPGTEVLIKGYDGEPYLRIRADGVVQHNVHSPAVSLNTSRGGGRVDTRADASAKPVWSDTGALHRVAWHDHRIHWMAGNDPVAAPGGVIQNFELPMIVNGTPVAVSGRLVLVRQGLPWAFGILAVVALVAYLLTRSAIWRLWLLTAASALALSLSIGWWLENPPEAGTVAWPLLSCALAMTTALVGLAVSRSRPRLADTAALASVAVLTGWWVWRANTIWAAVLPTVLPGWLDRAGTAFVAGICVGVVAAVLIRGSSIPAGSVSGIRVGDS